MNLVWYFVLPLVIFSGVNGVVAQTIPVEGEAHDIATTAVVRDARTPDPDFSYRDTGLSSESLPITYPETTGSVSATPFDEATMMRISDIRPGMKGYGMSVFSGFEPERFEAEVIGVRHRMLAGTDIIMCRLTSPHLVGIGVVAGMSGSPVYMDGKLIGAVAYGFTDVDDPLAGVTPIEAMLGVYNSTPVIPAQEPDDSVAGGGFGSFDNFMALKLDPSMENLKRVAMPGQSVQPLQVRRSDFESGIAQQYNLPDSFTLVPLSAPAYISSQHSLTSQLAASVFPSLNVVSTGQEAQAMTATDFVIPSTLARNAPGGPVENLQELSDSIVGGSSLAIPFVEGDMNMAGVGTVTWRNGNRLIAFGHPMFQNGTVYCPMAAARITDIVRSRTKPFKLGESVGQIGMVREDRLPAIGGLFGQTAKMFPVIATISDPHYQGKREFNYRVWNDRGMSPGLVLTTLLESIGTAARTGGDSAALYSYSIKLDDGTTVSAENYSSDANGTLMAVFGAMADTGILMNNPFKPVGVEEFSFEMRVMDRLRQAKIESSIMEKDVYRPGERATVEWLLRPFRQEPVRMTYSFDIPVGLPDGEYDIVISDAAARQSVEAKRNPGGEKLLNFGDVLRKVRENFAENRVYISLVDQDTGVSVSGSEMPKLPGRVISLIQDTVDGEYFDPVRGNFVVDADVATTYEVSGTAGTKLKVERK